MKKRLFRLRRWGVAAVAAATALGAISVVGGGTASAAIDSSTVVATSVNILAGATATTPGTWTITIPASNVPAQNDEWQVIVTPSGGCSSTSYLTVVSSGTLTATGGTGTAPTFSDAVTNAPGCSVASLVTIKDTLIATPGAGPWTLVVNNLTYAPSQGAAAGAVAVTADFLDASAVTGSVTFPSNATIGRFTVAGPTPVPNVAAASTDVTIGNVSVTEPFVAAYPNAALQSTYVCLTLAGGGTGQSFYPTSGNGPTVSATGGTGAATVTATATIQGATGKVLAFGIASSSTTVPTTFTVSGVAVDSPSAASGNTYVTLNTATSAANCSAAPLFSPGNAPNIFSTIGSSQPYEGATADTTAADEFEGTFNGCTENGGSVVLATDVDPYDALSASYLAGELGTGVLITPPVAAGGSLGSDASLAIRLMGVTNVYIVGGPSAIGAGLVAAIDGTPAYKCGGVTLTGSDVTVTANLYGTTDDDTAMAVNEYFPKTVVGSLANTSGAYNATGGLYDDTYKTYGGNGTVTGGPGTGTTAFLVSDTDYQDAITIGPISYAKHIPIILTPSPYTAAGVLATSLGADATAELTYLGTTQLIAIGGPLALPEGVLTSVPSTVNVLRISGQDGTDTAAQIANFETGSTSSNVGLGWAPTKVLLANGSYWSDPLGAEALAGLNDLPILLTEGPTAATAAAGIGTYTTAELNQAGDNASSPEGLVGTLVTSIEVLGGALAVPASQVAQAQADIAAG